MFGIAGQAVAQEPDDPKPSQGRPERLPDGINLLRQLGLSPEQAQSLRRLNQTQRPKMEAAQREFRAANEELDAAIYADTIDDELIAQRVARVETAQAALGRLRFENELAIRKLLTPEQLIRFREARERMRQIRDSFQNRRPDGPPMRRGDPIMQRRDPRITPNAAPAGKVDKRQQQRP